MNQTDGWTEFMTKDELRDLPGSGAKPCKGAFLIE